MNLETNIVNTLFSVFKSNAVEYCIVNNYEELPQILPNDIDIAIDIDSFKELDKYVEQIAHENGVEIIQKILNGYQKCAYILSPLIISSRFRVQLDFFVDYTSKGYPLLMSSSDLLYGKRKFNDFWIPSIFAESIFLILRRIVKGDMNETHMEKIRFLFSNGGNSIRDKLKEIFGQDMSNEIIEFVKEKDDTNFREKTYLFRKKLMAKSNKAIPLILKQKIQTYNLFRLFKRIVKPVGYSVVLLGPDGSGKSTIAKHLLKVSSGAFHGGKIQYWRPHLLPPMGRLKFWNPSEEISVNPRPHDHPQAKKIKSLIRFFYYWLDYLIGYPVMIFSKKIRKHIIIFDRYYYDYLVDLQRYQFNIPSWLPQFLLPTIPAPDLTVYLDVPPIEILNRKQELTLAELTRQVQCFRTIVKKIPRAITINAEKPASKVVEEIAAIILNDKAQKTSKQLN